MRVFLPDFALHQKRPKTSSPIAIRKQNKATAFNYRKFHRQEGLSSYKNHKNYKYWPQQMILKHQSLILQSTLLCRTLNMDNYQKNRLHLQNKQIPIHSRASSSKSKRMKKQSKFIQQQAFWNSIEHQPEEFNYHTIAIQGKKTSNFILGTKKTLSSHQPYHQHQNEKKPTNYRLYSSKKMKDRRFTHQYPANLRKSSGEFRPWSSRQVFDQEDHNDK